MTPSEYRQERKRIGLTQPQLSSLVGVSRVTISQRENGKVPITKEAAMAIQSLPKINK